MSEIKEDVEEKRYDGDARLETGASFLCLLVSFRPVSSV